MQKFAKNSKSCNRMQKYAKKNSFKRTKQCNVQKYAKVSKNYQMYAKQETEYTTTKNYTKLQKKVQNYGREYQSNKNVKVSKKKLSAYKSIRKYVICLFVGAVFFYDLSQSYQNIEQIY